MDGIRMVTVATLASSFQARVVVARLGAAGILARTDGADDGPYPSGPTTVLVDEAQLGAARALLGDDAPQAIKAKPISRVWLAVMAAVVVGIFVLMIASSAMRLH
ncbi:MAG: hypothetical protein ACR2H3_02465 [Acidimicrobiales bacterium]